MYLPSQPQLQSQKSDILNKRKSHKHILKDFNLSLNQRNHYLFLLVLSD